ncbi:TIGR01777 family oxidoreductase [Legionella anisa]|uniref:TIGR01777 family protein n=1 Tax=Legionella anisa TaxID=28082 RepID=A0AAX0WYC9_9GAMM|nr:TIGR01777 family oxidoreductase [Legionella anisa]AWN72902.1 TIGR01777 family protein [Legionella anisa]KTC70645.1 nucleoside-diphosphate sugar epimerase [Legionella anisa]MBN5936496.1 TIGR01777 family oxidoreductase [Legionella anisa]MCW8423712.1 TIGR01777 family oxidoreductase [Legionella anisa]MCW8447232.1 TIGR01777 family oxidoreductase [Legionella anisa]
MKIIIGGGTGLVGQILVPELLQSGHEIYVIGRDEEKIKRTFSSTVHGTTWDKLNTLNPNEFDAIINLAGENIADHRWSPKTKETLLTSRIKTTNQLVLWGIKADTKKPHLYNASAVGIYGLQKKLAQDHITFTETTPPLDSPETSFASLLVTQWEEAAKKGFDAGMPVTLMRFGVILKRGGGMLKKLELPARYGMGAVVGSGEQPLAWIDSTDLVEAIMYLIAHPEITGPVNLVAPESVSQKTFTKTFAQVLKKPAFLWMPAWIIRLLFGQMGEELLLSGQTVAPQRLSEYQFNFKYPTLLSALTKEFGG